MAPAPVEVAGEAFVELVGEELALLEPVLLALLFEPVPALVPHVGFPELAVDGALGVEPAACGVR